jgi:hypothetical protein
MTSTIAIMIVATIYVAALAPLAWIGIKQSAPAWMAGAYGVLIGAIAVQQSGLFAGPVIPSLADVSLDNLTISDAQCGEVLTLLDNAGVFIDRQTPPHLVVAQEGWNQLPPEAREAVIACVQRAWPRNTAPAQVEVRP